MMNFFDGGSVPLNLKVLSAAEARRHPALRELAEVDQIFGAISFTEYQFIWPERIVIDTIMKARHIGLEALNYSPVTGLERDGEGWRVTLAAREGQREVRCRAVVNCAGVWVDEITAMTGAKDIRLNTGAKGTNIVARLPDQMRGLGFETVTSTGASFYLIPWGDLHYIGPWDSAATGGCENFRATIDEIDAILHEMSLLMPGIAPTRKDVLYSWAGVRPRTARTGQMLGSMEVMEHDLTDRGMPNFFVFTGGLLMTHRDAGRRLTKAVSRRIPPSGQQQTLDYSAHLVPEGDKVSEISVAYVVEQEQARTLAGILRRRLPVGWDHDLGLSHAEDAARIAGPLLGWTKEQANAEIGRFRQETIQDFAPNFDTST